MNFKPIPGKVYDTIFFFIECFNKHEIENDFIKAYDNSDLMLKCYQKIEARVGTVPELLQPLFFIEDKRISPISLFFSNSFDFENDDIDSFVLKLTTHSDIVYQNTVDCIFNLSKCDETKKLLPSIAPGSYIKAIGTINLSTEFKLQLSLLLGNFAHAMSLLAAWMKKVYCIVDELHAKYSREISLEFKQIQSSTNIELYRNELRLSSSIINANVSISLLQQYLVYQKTNGENSLFLLFGLRNETVMLEKVDESKATAESFILACGSDVRMKIVKALIKHKEMTSSQIAKQMNIPVTTMIRHISTLQENGIIYVSRREKLQIFYRLNDKMLRKIKTNLDEMFDQILTQNRKAGIKDEIQ